jgi:hypothetical protein
MIAGNRAGDAKIASARTAASAAATRARVRDALPTAVALARRASGGARAARQGDAVLGARVVAHAAAAR